MRPLNRSADRQYSAFGKAQIGSALLLSLLALQAFGDDEKPGLAPPGLPGGIGGIDWKLHLDVTWGAFGFAHSLYANPRPDEPSGDLSDNWLEGSAKPALTGEYALDNSAK